MARTNIGQDPLKWSVLAGEREFQIDRKTIIKRLASAEMAPGEGDNLYSTKQIADAIYGGDLHSERLREIKERADGLALNNRQKRGELLPAKEVYSALAQVLHDLRGEILGNGRLTPDEKDSLLGRLSQIQITGKTPKAEPETEGECSTP
jgi:hypothetical protein